MKFSTKTLLSLSASVMTMMPTPTMGYVNYYQSLSDWTALVQTYYDDLAAEGVLTSTTETFESYSSGSTTYSGVVTFPSNLVVETKSNCSLVYKKVGNGNAWCGDDLYDNICLGIHGCNSSSERTLTFTLPEPSNTFSFWYARIGDGGKKVTMTFENDVGDTYTILNEQNYEGGSSKLFAIINTDKKFTEVIITDDHGTDFDTWGIDNIQWGTLDVTPSPTGAPTPKPPTTSPSTAPTGVPTPLPTSTPTDIPTAAPTERHCFQTSSELQTAVDVWLNNAYDAQCNYSNGYVHPTFGHISNWCVSDITDFSSVFSANRNSNARCFNEDLGNWDMSSATTFEQMFRNAVKFTGNNLNNWTVSTVTNFKKMFLNCDAFDTDLSNWDMQMAQNLKNMFKGATSFTGQGVDQWHFTPATLTNMKGLFNGASAFDVDLCQAWGKDELLAMIIANLEDMFLGTSCESDEDPVKSVGTGGFPTGFDNFCAVC